MKRSFVAVWFGVACVLLAIPTLLCTAQEKPPTTEVDGNIDWVFDYEQGKQLSRETGKPMFVVFRCER